MNCQSSQSITFYYIVKSYLLILISNKSNITNMLLVVYWFFILMEKSCVLNGTETNIFMEVRINIGEGANKI